uniref:RNase H domain-containing protein n=1 Tax=Strongyloides venezuelensis TaxID=75913 RepID=A0A0K0G1C0_STRVS
MDKFQEKMKAMREAIKVMTPEEREGFRREFELMAMRGRLNISHLIEQVKTNDGDEEFVKDFLAIVAGGPTSRESREQLKKEIGKPNINTTLLPLEFRKMIKKNKGVNARKEKLSNLTIFMLMAGTLLSKNTLKSFEEKKNLFEFFNIPTEKEEKVNWSEQLLTQSEQDRIKEVRKENGLKLIKYNAARYANARYPYNQRYVFWQTITNDSYVLKIIYEGYRIPIKEFPSSYKHPTYECYFNIDDIRFITKEIHRMLDDEIIFPLTDDELREVRFHLNPIFVHHGTRKDRIIVDCRNLNKINEKRLSKIINLTNDKTSKKRITYRKLASLLETDISMKFVYTNVMLYITPLYGVLTYGLIEQKKSYDNILNVNKNEINALLNLKTYVVQNKGIPIIDINKERYVNIFTGASEGAIGLYVKKFDLKIPRRFGKIKKECHIYIKELISIQVAINILVVKLKLRNLNPNTINLIIHCDNTTARSWIIKQKGNSELIHDFIFSRRPQYSSGYLKSGYGANASPYRAPMEFSGGDYNESKRKGSNGWATYPKNKGVIKSDEVELVMRNNSIYICKQLLNYVVKFVHDNNENFDEIVEVSIKKVENLIFNKEMNVAGSTPKSYNTKLSLEKINQDLTYLDISQQARKCFWKRYRSNSVNCIESTLRHWEEFILQKEYFKFSDVSLVSVDDNSHSVRSATVAGMLEKRVVIEKILEWGRWRSGDTLRQFYMKPTSR